MDLPIEPVLSARLQLVVARRAVAGRTALDGVGNEHALSRQTGMAQHAIASLLVSHRGRDVMIDCGADWLHAVRRVKPDAIVLTHAHPDHVDGLRQGAPCPVYAPPYVWQTIEGWPLGELQHLRLRRRAIIRGIAFDAYPIEHSTIAPAVGYRVSAGAATLFYAPDVLRIPRVMQTLRGIDLYVGDAATISRPIVRIDRKRHVPIGHASIAAQLEWCARTGVTRAIFTHCGRAIVAGPLGIETQISELGRARRIDAQVAHDGMQVVVLN